MSKKKTYQKILKVDTKVSKVNPIDEITASIINHVGGVLVHPDKPMEKMETKTNPLPEVEQDHDKWMFIKYGVVKCMQWKCDFRNCEYEAQHDGRLDDGFDYQLCNYHYDELLEGFGKRWYENMKNKKQNQK